MRAALSNPPGAAAGCSIRSLFNEEMGVLNRQVVLIARPQGIPQPAHFEVRSSPRGLPGPQQMLIENVLLSIDPAQRGYVNEENNYAAPVPVGGVMRSLAVGRVAQSNHARFSVGEYLYGWFGWQECCVCGPESVLRRVDPKQAPLAAAAGLLGINGLTARLALGEIGRPKPGETVLVTAGAGAVGSIVGQLAAIAGCRAVAVVGSDEKGRQCMEAFGYAQYINYRQAWNQALSRACPQGVDIFFDNVGGELLDGVLRKMNPFGRVIVCGTVATAAWVPPPVGLRNEREILTRRLRMEGFVIFDHVARFDSVAEELALMLEQGKLRVRYDVEAGLEQAPRALVDVYAGRNRGKKLIEIVRGNTVGL
jgi:NADPH-dependent curcumin reductase CurA